MATTTTKLQILLRRDTAANWDLYKDVVPAAGEPCFVIDKNILKIGDGATTFENLEPINGEKFEITADGKSVVIKDGILKLEGFDTATYGQVPHVGIDGNLVWGDIALRRDNDYNYKKIENTFIPSNGEVCLVDVAGNGLRAKVGNGVNTFKELPYADEAILKSINDLIIKGYFYQGKFYLDAEHTELLDGVTGRIYIDAVSGKLYTYNGINYETSNHNLPNATDEIAGVMKLYDQVGQNVDGTMTQRAITNELNEKFEIDVIEEEEMIVFDTDIN
jgi:hypothetical protein